MSTASRSERTLPAVALGMILFISSEVMFFAGLFGAYFTIRGRTAPWPPAGAEVEILLPAVATAILVASSVTVHRAEKAAHSADRGRAGGWLALTIALGAIFLGVQAYEFSQLGFGVADHSYGTLFFSMTGFHGAHVFGGIVMLTLVWIRNARRSEGVYASLNATSLYWHFVDVVWILLFATLYLLQ